ncbi:hypothetical protein [Bradyrhizobium sp. BR 1432]|uniref:hypothetical protein n=1 Tax=Bradyrhizobium sp. BR 1432 TaxID=3447966 RepID=UPI003EE728E6
MFLLSIFQSREFDPRLDLRRRAALATARASQLMLSWNNKYNKARLIDQFIYKAHTMSSADKRPLRPGDVVEVRSAAEILATLDGDAALEKLPFMPEMARYAGRRFTVTRRVDRICDTITATGSRRMSGTVYLDSPRCDGAGHDGCQAGCLLYWKDAWLRRVDDKSGVGDESHEAAAELDRLAQAGTRTVREIEGQRSEVWRCQATDALKATTELKKSNLAQYWRELTNGNFGFLYFIRLLVRGLILELARRAGLRRPLPLRGPGNCTRGSVK